MAKCKKGSPKNDKSWVDVLRKKLEDYTQTTPAPSGTSNWPTYMSERARRMREQDPTATGLGQVDEEESK